MQIESNQFNSREKILIIVPCYKREIGLTRIINAVNSIPDNKCHLFDLLISQDGGGSKKLTQKLKSFNIKINNKIIIQKKNIGLKNHILSLCDKVKNYRACIVVEDDIFLAQKFYDAALDLIKLVEDNNSFVVGASLYSPSYNEYANSLFHPIKNKNDFYTSSVPSSWGQIWTSKTWYDFRHWLSKKTNADILSSSLPNFIKSWPETSWKKYLALYLLSMNKKIIYPYNSFATNMCDDGGEHLDLYTNLFQVDIGDISESISIKKNEEVIIDYDSHFNINAIHFKNLLPNFYNDLIVDLYSTKNIALENGKYVLTRAISNNDFISSFSDKLIPIEMNIFFKALMKDEKGKIFLIEKQKFLYHKNKTPYFESDIKISIFRLKFIKYYLSAVFKKCVNKFKLLFR